MCDRCCRPDVNGSASVISGSASQLGPRALARYMAAVAGGSGRSDGSEGFIVPLEVGPPVAVPDHFADSDAAQQVLAASLHRAPEDHRSDSARTAPTQALYHAAPIPEPTTHSGRVVSPVDVETASQAEERRAAEDLVRKAALVAPAEPVAPPRDSSRRRHHRHRSHYSASSRRSHDSQESRRSHRSHRRHRHSSASYGSRREPRRPSHESSSKRWSSRRSVSPVATATSASQRRGMFAKAMSSFRASIRNAGSKLYPATSNRGLMSTMSRREMGSNRNIKMVAAHLR